MKRLLLVILCLPFNTIPMERARQLTTPYKPKHIPTKRLFEEPINRKCNNIIMVFDPSDEEPSHRRPGGAGCSIVSAALIERIAPILTTKNILMGICFDKTYPAKSIEDRPSGELSQIYTIQLNNNYWYCIVHKKADLVLLIPTDYVTTNMQSLSSIEQIISCGFNINNADFYTFKTFSHESLWDYLSTSTSSNYIDIIDAIKNLFTVTISDENSPSWNMYIMGHGYPSQTKKTLPGYLENLTQKQSYLKHKNSYINKKIQQSQKLINEAQNLDDNTIISDSGQIAGLMTNDFLDLLAFFNNNLKMSFLYYTTCYGAGSNLAVVADSLAQLKVDFIVSCQGITEHQTSSPNVFYPISKQAFTYFFFALRNFFNDPHQFIASHLAHDPIKSILSIVVNPEGQGFVRIPSVGIFSSHSVDKKVKILTNAMIKAHEFENKPIDCTDPNIKTIMIHSSYIGVPLKMNIPNPFDEHSNCKLALALPQNTAFLTKRKVCVFENIQYPGTITLFIKSLINLNQSYTPITFVIKKLECLNKDEIPLFINNMICSIKGERSPEGFFGSEFYSEKTCLFSSDNNNYISKIDWMNYLTNSDQIEEILPRDLASKVIDSEDIKHIPSDTITLPLLVEQLEKKTSKEFSVQDLGSLQKILGKKIGQSTKSLPIIEEDPTRRRMIEESRQVVAEKSYQPKPSVIKTEKE